MCFLGGLQTVIGSTMYVDRWTCTLEPSSFNRRSALTFTWAWSFYWRSQPSTLYQVPRPPHKTSISQFPVRPLYFDIILAIYCFFHVDPLIAYTSCPLSSELLQHRIINCLSSKNVELYDIECRHIHVHLIHGSLPLLAILTFNFRCFDRWT